MQRIERRIADLERRASEVSVAGLAETLADQNDLSVGEIVTHARFLMEEVGEPATAERMAAYISQEQGIPVETILTESQVILDRAKAVLHGPPA